MSRFGGRASHPDALSWWRRRVWQDSCLENPHGQRSLAGCSPWNSRVRRGWATKTLVERHRLWSADLSSWATRALSLWFWVSGAQAQQLWPMGFVAPWHVGASWTRGRTGVSCVGRQILYHWVTREALDLIILNGCTVSSYGSASVYQLLSDKHLGWLLKFAAINKNKYLWTMGKF